MGGGSGAPRRDIGRRLAYFSGMFFRWVWGALFRSLGPRHDDWIYFFQSDYRGLVNDLGGYGSKVITREDGIPTLGFGDVFRRLGALPNNLETRSRPGWPPFPSPAGSRSRSLTQMIALGREYEARPCLEDAWTAEELATKYNRSHGERLELAKGDVPRGSSTNIQDNDPFENISNGWIESNLGRRDIQSACSFDQPNTYHSGFFQSFS